MNKYPKRAAILLPLLIWLATIGAALAAAPGSDASPAHQPQRTVGDLGDRIVNQGGSGFAACVGCHGAQGEGQAASGFPRLAGQTSQYLDRQLEAYADGRRINAVMTPIAKAMNHEQRQAAAEHYAALPPMPANAGPSGPTGDGQSNARSGRTLAMVGSESRNVQACANCHGPDGTGSWPAIPALAGQHASYLQAALGEWKDGSRTTDPSGQMPRIAKALTDDELKVMAAYYAALPAPTRSLVAPPNDWVATRTERSGPVAQNGNESPSNKGTGTEQGAALTGGTQGVGGPPASSSSSDKR